jgi:hypothetical protein
MPEGDLHKLLVRRLTQSLRMRANTSWFMFVDGDDDQTHGCPPQLINARPDVYARERERRHLVIGEAKTRDVDTLHTHQQLETYFHHLAQELSGELVMAVPYFYAGQALWVCRHARRKVGADAIRFEVSGWMFGSSEFSRTFRG